MIQHLTLLVVLHTSTAHSGEPPAAGRESKLSCVNDYIVTVKCTLGAPGHPEPAQNVSRWLEFERNDGEKFSCPLAGRADYFGCAFQSSDTFTDVEWFTITLRTAVNPDGIVMEKAYRPVKHIKPLTPCNLTVRWVSDAYYAFTWDHGYESIRPPVFLTKRLQYKLSYYKSGQPDKVVENRLLNKTIRIAGDTLDPDSEYVAKVRSGPPGTQYEGEWSSWSQAVQWRTGKRTKRDDGADNAGDVKASGTAFLCVPLGAMALLCFWRKTRSKRNTYARVPSPAPFFHSLYSNYKGDFRRWLESQGNPGGPLKVDAQKIDTLTEVKPVDNKGMFAAAAAAPAPSFHSTPSPAVYVNPCSCSGTSSPQGGQHAPAPAPFLTDSASEMPPDGKGSDPRDPTPESLQRWPAYAPSAEPKSTSSSQQYCMVLGARDDLVPCTVFRHSET